MLRLVHTADWQIGRRFGAFAEEAGHLLARQRIDTVRRIAELARTEKAHAVLVAGDVFDTNAVADDTIRATLVAMEGFAGPWVLLPGNHDAALSESAWSRLRRIGVPAGVILADSPEPMALAGCAAVVLPAPLVRRQESVDLTEWFDTAETPPEAVRIGLAHGSVADFLPTAADAANPIAHDRAERARLDYLALGDWHGTLQVGSRTWYAGTPEPDRFKANDPGNVLLVEIAAPGAPPAVRRLPVGRFVWSEVAASVHDDADVRALADRLLAPDVAAERRVVALTLDGAVSLAVRQALDDALADVRARVHALRVDDDGLIAEPDDDDLDRVDTLGFVRAAMETLRARAADPADPERETARRALHILYAEHLRLGG